MKSNSQIDSRRLPRPPLHYRVMHGVMGPMMKVFGLSCRQFAELAAARMDRSLSKGESLRFRFHRAICGLCRPLPAQFDHLRSLIRCVCREDADEVKGEGERPVDLSSDACERIREALAAEQATNH